MDFNPLELRDGEALATALNDARNKAREWRQKATEATAEANRWDEVVRTLENAQNLTRVPANSVNKRVQPPVSAAQSSGRSFTKWRIILPEAVREWNSIHPDAGGPTKKELLAHITKTRPNLSETNAIQAIYQALNSDRLIMRQGEKLFLPGTEPERKVVAEARQRLGMN